MCVKEEPEYYKLVVNIIYITMQLCDDHFLSVLAVAA